MKIKLNQGIKLNKEAITKLQESQMSIFKGGLQNDAEDSPSDPSCNMHSCIGLKI